MFKYPDPFPTTTSGAKTLMCKTFQVKYTDVYLQYAANIGSQGTLVGGNGGFGFNPNNAYGTPRGLKVVLPTQATIAGMALYNNVNANTAGTTPAAFLAVGRSIGFTTIVGNGTTCTVTTPAAHGLTATDVIHVTDTFLATGVATTALNTVTPVTVNGVTTNTVDGNAPKVVTPSASTPNQFTFLSAFNGTAVGGLIVCLSYYAYPSVLASGTPIPTGFQWLGIKNVGTFAATTPASYWAVAPSANIGNVTTPGTPAVWCVSGALNTTLGGDGNYNYFVEPGQDAYIYGLFQEYATSGLVAATAGGPWTVWLYYFI
jgi:hypothetical protein